MRKCETCGTEFDGNFCPGCGKPADQNGNPGGGNPPPNAYDDSSNKDKKPFYTKWWFWAVAAVLLFAIIGGLGNNDNEPGMPGGITTTTAGQQTSKSTTTAPPVTTTTTINMASVEKEYTLSDGYYTAGIDLPVGKCNLTAVSGDGNVSSSNLLSGGINAMFGVDKSGTGLYTSSFTGLKMDKKVVLHISGGLTIKITYTAITDSFVGRTANESKAVTLTDGNYDAGTDFPEGVYTIKAVSGKGNISSSNLIQGGVNEMFGIDDTGMYTAEVKHVSLPKGTTLTISGGLTIKLIPVTNG